MTGKTHTHFQEGKECSLGNYRSVSLISVSRKLVEDVFLGDYSMMR